MLCWVLVMSRGLLSLHRGTWDLWLWHCGMWNLVPWPGIEPRPLHWEHGVLAARPPGKSCIIHFFKGKDWADDRCLEVLIDHLIDPWIWLCILLKNCDWDLEIFTGISLTSLNTQCCLKEYTHHQDAGQPFPWPFFSMLGALAQWPAHTGHSGFLVKDDHVISKKIALSLNRNLNWLENTYKIFSLKFLQFLKNF